jgi:hypothetical protein
VEKWFACLKIRGGLPPRGLFFSVSEHVGNDFADNPNVLGAKFLAGVCQAELEIEPVWPAIVQPMDLNGNALLVVVAVPEDHSGMAPALGVLVKYACHPRPDNGREFEVEKGIVVFVEMGTVILVTGADSEPDFFTSNGFAPPRRNVDGSQSGLADIQIGIRLVVNFSKYDAAVSHCIVLLNSVG